jgi:hypothetical protein
MENVYWPPKSCAIDHFKYLILKRMAKYKDNKSWDVCCTRSHMAHRKGKQIKKNLRIQEWGLGEVDLLYLTSDLNETVM